MSLILKGVNQQLKPFVFIRVIITEGKNREKKIKKRKWCEKYFACKHLSHMQKVSLTTER